MVVESKLGSQSAATPVPQYTDISLMVRRRPGLLALDADWQYPAVTEQHAYCRLADEGSRLPEGMLYVAYPWATLIDKLNNNAADKGIYLNRFEQFCRLLPTGGEKVTVCQHIHARRFQHLFANAGIRTIFWSHATLDDVYDLSRNAASVHFLPFPLFPVRVPKALEEASPKADGQPRPYLFSFIGARANQYYLTEVRKWILELLHEDPRGLIIGCDNWHYQKIVYDLQVRGKITTLDVADLLDMSAADQFRVSLQQSIFSLCPSGSGPNSIRLWESIGAGAIPVVLADTLALPGNRGLWDLAAVFCKEDPNAIRALPHRLAQIAEDPPRLVQMRHAMRQLWLEYGPQGFVSDVQALLLSHGGQGRYAAVPERVDAARILLLDWSARLLINPENTLAALNAPMTAQALEKAKALAAGSGLTEHFHAVLDHARGGYAATATPAVARGAVPKVALLGKHSHRTPFGYAAFRQMIGERVVLTEDAAGADLIVSGFNADWRENIAVLSPLLARKIAPKLAIFSEEPLWDETWSGPFTGREARMMVNGSEIPYTFLGHETSEIYAFDRLPYFVLTDERFAVRYAARMALFRPLSPEALLNRWRAAPASAAFFAEKRGGEAYMGEIPERDITKLSAYRTLVAEHSQESGVLRVGKGWGFQVQRQDLPDWHLDKLAQLDGRVRMVASYENVHQRHYISEKIFDAFAVGGVPVYFASPQHRVFELVPAATMLNTRGLDPVAAAARIASFRFDRELAEGWLAACDHLARLFGDFHIVRAERQRVADAVVAEVARLI